LGKLYLHEKGIKGVSSRSGESKRTEVLRTRNIINRNPRLSKSRRKRKDIIPKFQMKKKKNSTEVPANHLYVISAGKMHKTNFGMGGHFLWELKGLNKQGERKTAKGS